MKAEIVKCPCCGHECCIIKSNVQKNGQHKRAYAQIEKLSFNTPEFAEILKQQLCQYFLAVGGKRA